MRGLWGKFVSLLANFYFMLNRNSVLVAYRFMSGKLPVVWNNCGAGQLRRNHIILHDLGAICIFFQLFTSQVNAAVHHGERKHEKLQCKSRCAETKGQDGNL